MITEILTSIGLTPEQAELYTSLLDHGAQTAGKLSKTTKIQRTYVYPVARELVKKGLVAMEKKGRTTTFVPQPPERLLSQAEDVKTHAAQAYAALQGILPGLKTKYEIRESKPIVRYYEGEKGIIKANLEVLAEKKEILAYLVINKDIDRKLEKFWDTYYAMRVENKIYVRAITPNTKEGIEYKRRDTKEMRETRLVPKDKFPITIEKNIVGNKVVFFSTKDGKLVATIVENKEIADTERAIFELAWKQADHFNRKLST